MLYLAQKAPIYFSSDTFHCNKLWKNFLEKSAIRAGEGHTDLEHIVWSWQEKDAGMEWWDASVLAVAVEWVEKQFDFPENTSHLASSEVWFSLRSFHVGASSAHAQCSARLNSTACLPCHNGLLLHFAPRSGLSTLTTTSTWTLRSTGKSEKQHWCGSLRF